MTIEMLLTDDKVYTLDLITISMSRYFKKYGITIETDVFNKNWLYLNNFIILWQGQKVGVVRYDINDEFCNLRDLHIEPQYQGKGIGSAVVRLVTDEMRLKGLKFVRLKVFKDNPAIELYKRLGFKLIDEEDNLIRMMLDLS